MYSIQVKQCQEGNGANVSPAGNLHTPLPECIGGWSPARWQCDTQTCRVGVALRVREAKIHMRPGKHALTLGNLTAR